MRNIMKIGFVSILLLFGNISGALAELNAPTSNVVAKIMGFNSQTIDQSTPEGAFSLALRKGDYVHQTSISLELNQENNSAGPIDGRQYADVCEWVIRLVCHWDPTEKYEVCIEASEWICPDHTH